MPVLSRRTSVTGIIATVIVVGCNPGPATGKVSGQVLLKGEPYGGAAIVFFSTTTGGGGTADLAADGSFSLPQSLEVGDYCVYLAPKLVVSNGDATAPAPVAVDGSVPEKYWSESSTDIVINIKPGETKTVVQLSR